jgi:putative endonuclease
MYFVYILKSVAKKWYYVGSTNDLERRFAQHTSGSVNSTKGFLPLKIVYTKEFDNESDARAYEHKLKDCRKEKEKIIVSL